MKTGVSLVLIFVFCLLCPAALAQVGRRFPGSEPAKKRQETPAEAKPAETPKPQTPEADGEQEVDDGEAVKVETNLVTVPVIASDNGGRYIPDLKAEEFNVSEDNAEQKVAFFATVTEPFSVVLMIDTSASATVEKLRQVQEAAVYFTEQLREGDRVKVISFDDEVRDLSRLHLGPRRARLGHPLDAAGQGHAALRRLRPGVPRAPPPQGAQGRHHTDGRRGLPQRPPHVRRQPPRGRRVGRDRLPRALRHARGDRAARARAGARGSGPVDLGGVLGRIPGMPPGSVVINPRGGGRPEEDRSQPRRPPRRDLAPPRRRHRHDRPPARP